MINLMFCGLVKTLRLIMFKACNYISILINQNR